MEEDHKKYLIIAVTATIVIISAIIIYLVLTSGSCPADINLICGRDHITYANECSARKNGATISGMGMCAVKISTASAYKPGMSVSRDGALACTNVIQLTCGIDGKTYSNPCLAISEDIKISHIGECVASTSNIRGTTCKASDDYVCTYPGTTYQNSCLANHYGALIISTGKCEDCTEQKPVCGVNNVTYANECAAKMHLITVAYSGFCRKN